MDGLRIGCHANPERGQTVANGCGVRTGVDHPPPVAAVRPDAVRERQLSLPRAADSLRPAYSYARLLAFHARGRKHPIARIRIRCILLPATYELCQQGKPRSGERIIHRGSSKKGRCFGPLLQVSARFRAGLACSGGIPGCWHHNNPRNDRMGRSLYRMPFLCVNN